MVLLIRCILSKEAIGKDANGNYVIISLFEKYCRSARQIPIVRDSIAPTVVLLTCNLTGNFSRSFDIIGSIIKATAARRPVAEVPATASRVLAVELFYADLDRIGSHFVDRTALQRKITCLLLLVGTF